MTEPHDSTPQISAPLLLDRAAFAALLSMGASTFDRHKAAGLIGPQPVRIGGCLRWHRPEVEAWLAHGVGGELLPSDAWPVVWEQIVRGNRPKRPMRGEDSG